MRSTLQASETPAADSGVSSLTKSVLKAIALPTAVAAAVLGIVGYLTISDSVESVNDRILGAASRAIAESLTSDNGRIQLDLSPAIFGMLETNSRDNVYYSIRHKDQVISGYKDLPTIASRVLKDTEVIFENAQYRGQDIRLVAEARRVPGIRDPIIIEVAETMGARERTTRRMLIGLVLLEGILIALMIFLMPVAVRLGLRPLISFSSDLDKRQASDLTPLPLRQVPFELQNLVNAFNGVLERLDGAVEGMRRFTADASHQMRTPLSILKAHITLMQRIGLKHPNAELSLNDIDLASDRLSNLLIQLLALARAEGAASARPSLTAIDMNAVAAGVVADLSLNADRQGIALHFVEWRGSALARSHALLAGELVSNIADNAVRYNRRGGSVYVAVIVESASVLVTVDDDGPGISIEDRARIFSRFTRLDRDNAASGSGLGLSIASALATALDAELSLNTGSTGKGLHVEIRFPVEPLVTAEQ